MRNPISRLLFCCLALPFICHAATPAPAYESNPDFQKARAEAQKFAKSSTDRVFAEAAWRKANKIAGGKCMDCFVGMVQAARSVGDPKATLKDAVAMEQAADTPADRSVAQMFQGRALMDQAGHDKPKATLLEQAHTLFAKAEETDPTTSSAFFFDGMALAMLSRDGDASAAFKSYLAHTRPTDIYRARAERLAQNPDLVRQKMAPPVVVATLDGKQFNHGSYGWTCCADRLLGDMVRAVQ